MKPVAVFLALASLCLVGCAPNPPARVLVPVAVPCKVDAPKPPVWATSALGPDSDIWDQVKALLAERRQRIGYGLQLQAAIDACQPSPPPAGGLGLRLTSGAQAPAVLAP